MRTDSVPRLLAADAIEARKIEMEQITKQYRFGPPLYLAAFGVSFVSEGASIGLCLLVAFFSRSGAGR
jgi:heme oxygenase